VSSGVQASRGLSSDDSLPEAGSLLRKSREIETPLIFFTRLDEGQRRLEFMGRTFSWDKNDFLIDFKNNSQGGEVEPGLGLVKNHET
jgi:hypothetical protein